MNKNEIINNILEEANKNNKGFNFKIKEEEFCTFERISRIGFLNWEIANNIIDPKNLTILRVIYSFKESKNEFTSGFIFMEKDNKTYSFYHGGRLKEKITTKSIKELTNKMNEDASFIEEYFKNIKNK